MSTENSPVLNTMDRSRDRVDKYVYRQLMMLKDGERMPSIRSIMRDCACSQSTVQTVLRDYQERDLLRPRDRRGLFKVGNSELDSKIFEELDLIYCTSAKDEDPLTKFHGEFSLLLGKICGEDWRSIRMHFLETRNDLSEFRALARSNTCRACIVVASPSHAIGRIMEANNVAYVNLFPESPQLDPDAVNIIIDNDDVVTKQLDHLTSLGHRKIAYIHCLRPDETIRDLLLRRESFYRQALERGLTLDPNWIQYGGYDSETCLGAMERIMSVEMKPTAVIASDHHIPGIYHYLSERGIRPGRDFSVLGTDNLSISRLMSPQVSSLGISMTGAAATAMKTLEDIISGKQVPKTIHIETKVIARDSTAPLVS